MKWASFDPGESTGWATWRDGKLIDRGTTRRIELEEALSAALAVTPPRDATDPNLVKTFRGISLIVYENWNLYPWKLRNGEMDMDECRTARHIGAIEFLARTAGVPYVAQPAAIKDQAEAAGAELLFSPPLHENRHQNDAIRHGVYYWRIGRHGKDFEPTWQPSPAS